MSSTRKSIQTNLGKISYQLIGSGYPMMLIHGYQCDGRIWEPSIKGLEKEYRFILPDLAGHGQSESLSKAQNMQSYVQSLERIMQAESLSKMAVFGHSMGGYVAMAMTERKPSKISFLGLINSHPFADGPEKKLRREKEIQAIKSGKAKLILKLNQEMHFGHLPDREKTLCTKKTLELGNQQSEQGMLDDLIAMRDRKDQTAFLLSTKVPYRFYLSEQDKRIDLKRITELFSPEKIELLDGLGHMSLIEDNERIMGILSRMGSK